MAEEKKSKFEKRLEELDAKADAPAKEAALRAALVDVIAKTKDEEARAEAAKVVIEEAEKAVQVAEDDLAGKKPEEPVEPEPVV